MKLGELWWRITSELNPHRLTHRKALAYCKKHFNEIGIYAGYNISLLIGFGEGDDFYYLLRTDRYLRNKPDSGKDDFEDVYSSMVGGWYSIKGMGKKGYNYTEINAKIPKAEKFVEKYWEDE